MAPVFGGQGDSIVTALLKGFRGQADYRKCGVPKLHRALLSLGKGQADAGAEVRAIIKVSTHMRCRRPPTATCE